MYWYVLTEYKNWCKIWTWQCRPLKSPCFALEAPTGCFIRFGELCSKFDKEPCENHDQAKRAKLSPKRKTEKKNSMSDMSLTNTTEPWTLPKGPQTAPSHRRSNDRHQVLLKKERTKNYNVYTPTGPLNCLQETSKSLADQFRIIVRHCHN